MIFLVDLSHPDLFHADLFTKLQGTFYMLVEGPASAARVERIKNAFPDLSLGTVKVVFVKSFAPSTIRKFAVDKCEHPDLIVDLRPSEWMLHTHLFPPSVSREVIRSTPHNYELRDRILKMILDTMCAIIGGVRIRPDDFPVLAHIQNKFGEFLDIGELEGDGVEDFDPYKHSVYCKPRDHIWARMDPSGTFRWPIHTELLKTIRTVLDRISFEDLSHLAEHEELVQSNYSASTEVMPDDDVLPMEIREFVCSRAQMNGAFMCMANELSPEFSWVDRVTNGFPEPAPIDLLIETRTDPSVQIDVLVESFEQIAPGGIVFFKRPDTSLTVMLSTWNTPVPLGSLHGNLSRVFKTFARFHACTDGSLWIQKQDCEN